MKRSPSVDLFFLPCPRGLESLLCEEIASLGGEDVRQTPGGVECRGEFSLCYRLNLNSRLASRVLWRVGSGVYRTEEDLYQLTFQQPWHERFSVRSFIKVKVIAHLSPLKSLDFATLRVKDAICDRFVQECGDRPGVDRQRPDVPLVVYLNGHEVFWYVDTSGAPLFKRGWRKAAGEAPIRENLAAGILDLTGWSPGQVLLDPMCGAGTFLIEAALKGKAIPPGLGRSFAFTQLSNMDQGGWAQVRQAGEKGVALEKPLDLFGFDQNVRALEMARENCRGLGLQGIHWAQEDVLHVVPPAPQGIMLTNPPYGVRMGDQKELEAWYPQFGNVLKQRFAGWRVFIFTADLRLPKLIRLTPSRKQPLFNGSLESRLYEFQMVKGGHRKTARLARQAGNKPGG